MISITESGSSVALSVKVHPRAKKNAITGELDGALKISLTAPPIDGKSKRILHRILRETFEGTAFFRYHCLRPEQSPESDPSVRALG